MNPITIQTPTIPVPLPPSPPGVVGEAGAENPFIDLMTQSVQQVNTMQATADTSVQKLLTGKDVNSAEVLTAVQKADMAFRLLQQVRNKLVDAYREINQMQI